MRLLSHRGTLVVLSCLGILLGTPNAKAVKSLNNCSASAVAAACTAAYDRWIQSEGEPPPGWTYVPLHYVQRFGTVMYYEGWCKSSAWWTHSVYTTCAVDLGPIANATVAPTPSSPALQCGSILNVDSLSAGESIPINGTGYHLTYMTHRSRSRVSDMQAVIPLVASPLDSDIQSVELKIQIAGQVITQTFTPSAGLKHTFTWNGLDDSGQFVNGRAQGRATVSYTYASAAEDFPAIIDFAVGSFSPEPIGLGGWSISPVHYLDVADKTLYLGDGNQRKVKIKTLPNDRHMVVSQDGSEVYIFENNGRHIQTQNGLSGAPILNFAYDGAGRLSSITDAYSNQTTVLRNSSGAPTGIQSPYGQVTQLTVNANGQLASVANPANETHQMTYETATGLLKTYQSPKGQTSTFTYDSLGLLKKDENSSGQVANFLRTVNGSQTNIKYTTAEGRMTSYDISLSSSYMRTTTLPNGNTIYTLNMSDDSSDTTNSPADGAYQTNYSADPRWGASQVPYVSSTSETIGSKTIYTSISKNVEFANPSEPDPFNLNKITTRITRSGKVTESVYESATKTTTVTSPLGRYATYTIDDLGKLTSFKKAWMTPTQYQYDERGRLKKTVTGARQTSIAYSTQGRVSSITNALNQSTSYQYDNAGRITSQTLPDLRVIGYSYDANGNLASVTPPGRPAHVINVNLFDLISEYSAPPLAAGASTASLYAYNNDKQLTQVQRPDGSTINFNYGATTGQLNTITTPNGTYTYTMANGHPVQVVSPDGIRTQRNYTQSVVTGELFTNVSNNARLGFISFTFNNKAQLESDVITGSNNVTSHVGYTYDDDGLLKTVGAVNLNLSPTTGFVLSTTMGLSTDAYGYNYFGELTSYQAKYDSSTLYDLAYTRDNLGRVTAKTETIDGVTDTYGYTYDSAGRLTDVTKNGVAYGHANYDSNSNRTSGTVAGAAFTATYDVQDRLKTFNSKTYTYDANGDLSSIYDSVASTTTTYSYDAFGNLKSVVMPTKTASYLYDGHNRRVARIFNGSVQARYVYYDQYRIAAELNPLGEINKRFVYAAKSWVPEYMIRANVRYRIITDHLGSVRLVVNTNDGSIAQRINYNENGRIIYDSNPGFQPFGFAGGLHDIDTRLVRFGARDYDTDTGRWTSKDPILFAGGDTNLYGYVLQDPINFIDPSGLRTFGNIGSVVQGALAGAIAGGAYGSIAPGVGTFGGAIAGGIVGGLAGAVGNRFGGNLQSVVDLVSGSIIGGTAGAVGGSLIGGTGAGFVGGMGGALAGGAYCSDKINPERDLNDLLNQFNGFESK